MVNPRKHPIRTAVVAFTVMLGPLAGACGNDDADPAAGDGTSTTEVDGGALWNGPMPNTQAMTPEDAGAIDDEGAEIISQANGQVPGMWVGVWDAEKGKHLGAYGNAVVGGTGAATDQIGRIGSVTTTFTAAAMLQQVSEGWASLDDTIESLLPDLAGKYPDVADITVEQLVGMTSGIPDYADSDWFLPLHVEDPTRVWTADEIIDETLDRGGLSDPGTPGYSTTNYLILGQMLEQVVEGDEEISTIVTDLAGNEGLTRTALPEPSDSSMPDPYSNGYVTEAGSAELAANGATVPAGTDVTSWSPSWGGAGGAMYANLEDLGTWASTGLGTGLLDERLGQQRISDTKELPETGEYGLGLQVWGNGWIGHTGRIVGWEALVAYNTDTGDVFVAIVNETGSLLAATALASEIFPELGAALID
jgi:D-alanyl-D-alanine carboxypeptidase